MSKDIEEIARALWANLRIEPVPHTMYDWRIAPESVDEAVQAVYALFDPALNNESKPAARTGSENPHGK